MPPQRIPLVFVKSGRLVWPDAKGTWRPTGKPDDDQARARRLFAQGEHLYVFDLDGQASGVANLEFLQRLERGRVFPWVDPGPRKPDDAVDVLFAGAEALTVQPRHMRAPGIREIHAVSEADIHLGLTAGPDGLEGGQTARDVLAAAQEAGAAGIVLYETDGADLYRIEREAFELRRGDLRVAWMALPRSALTSRAVASERFTHVLVPGDPG